MWTAWQWRAALQSGCYIITCLWHHLVRPSRREKAEARGLLITIMSHIVWIKTGFFPQTRLRSVNARRYISVLMISQKSCVGKGARWPERRSLFKAACDSSFFSFFLCLWNNVNKDKPLSSRVDIQIGPKMLFHYSSKYLHSGSQFSSLLCFLFFLADMFYPGPWFLCV